MNILVDCKRIGEEFLPLSAAIQQPAHSEAGLRFAPVGAGRVVYTPFRSLLNKRHWRLATLARAWHGPQWNEDPLVQARRPLAGRIAQKQVTKRIIIIRYAT